MTELAKARSELDDAISDWDSTLALVGTQLDEKTQRYITTQLSPLWQTRGQWRSQVDALNGSLTLQHYSGANRLVLDTMALLANQLNVSINSTPS